MFVTYSLFIAGFYFLIKGANWLIEGSSSIAKKFRVSDLMIGLTIVSFGTSSPELFVNLIASFNGNSDLAIANIVGSNISNILLILGIAAIIYPLTVKKGTTSTAIPLNMLAVVALWLLVNDVLIDGGSLSVLTRIDGFILLLFFFIFIYYTFGITKVEGSKEYVEEKNTFISIMMVLAGIVGLGFGGKWIVDGAIDIATKFNMSESLIGLTIVAIGTSLPELVTSAVAAFKHNADIAIGNVIGSNIFNIFWILGLSSVVKPLFFSDSLNFDIYFMGVVTLLLLLFVFIGRKNQLGRSEGILLVLIYILYLIYTIYRG